MADQRARVHLIPYNYSLVHQNPGNPLVVNKQQIFHLAQSPIPNQPQITGNDNLVNENLLLQLTDCDTLDEIRVISLRNKDLTSCLKVLAQCENLTIAYLQGNKINLHDMMYMQMFTSLKKIDLSQNDITSLPGQQVFQGLVNLKFLYLHNNRISNWNDITSLTSLPSIMHITLFSNPACSIPGYRHFLVNSIPSLLALDNYVITDEERIEDASFGYRFRALNEYMKLHIPDYAKEKSAEQHLFNLEVDIYRLRRIYERNSPSILIQSLYRGYRSRNYVKVYFNERKQKIIKIQKVVRGWLMRKKFKKDLRDMLAYTNQEYLLLSNTELRRRYAGNVIKRFMLKKFKERRKQQQQENSVLTIQRYYKGRFVKNTSFINALQLNKYPKLYFLKEQRPIFMKILKSLMPLFEQKNNLRLDKLVQCIKEDSKYDTIRVAEPDLFDYKQNPLVQFTKPSAISKIRFNKNSNGHIFNEDFSLEKILFKPNGEDDKRKWQILKVRNNKVRREQIYKALEKSKKNILKSQYMFQDQYRDFLYFEGPSLDILVTLCFAILDYNRQAYTDEQQQFLLFFEPILDRVAAASRIQSNWRAYLHRKKQNKYPIEDIIEKRAAYCLQRWWSNIKLKKRMDALERIKKHIDKIKSHEVYIEQSLYNHIHQIYQIIHSQMKFEEQHISFDFNAINHQIYLQVNEKEKPKFRYTQQSIPKWFNLNFRPPEFPQSPYYNNLQAFFHYNEGDCMILPSTYVIEYDKNSLDIDRDLYFLQMKCSSVEEAKRRAYVLAVLTYDIHQHVFVQLHTSDMLQDPFMIANIYKIKQRFDLNYERNDVDVKWHFSEQLKQPHKGLILSEKDHRLSRFAQTFKRIQLENQRNILISCQDKFEATQIEKEMMYKENRSFIDLNGSMSSNFYESKKLHQEAFTMIKEKRLQAIKDSVNEFKEVKNGEITMKKELLDRQLEEKKDEVIKIREISKIINNEQKNELNKNLQVFLTLNKEEKILRKELVEKQMEVEFKEKYLKKMTVIQHHKNRAIKKEEQDKFINAFTQAKNLIEKSMKIGNKIKEKKLVKQQNTEKITQQRQIRLDSKIQEKQPIRNVLFETSIQSTQMSRAQMLTYDHRSNPKKTDIFTTGVNNTTMINESFQNHSRHNAAKSAGKAQNRSHYLPPLKDSFANSNRRTQKQNQMVNQTFQSYNNNNLNSEYELSKDIEEIYKNTVMNRQKKSFTRPVFTEENYPLVKASQNLNSFGVEPGESRSEFRETYLDQARYVRAGGSINRKEPIDLRNSTRTYLINNMNII